MEFENYGPLALLQDWMCFFSFITFFKVTKSVYL